MAGKKILTVCTANINRSTTAAFLLKVMDYKNEVWSRGSNQIACRIHGGIFCTEEDFREADEIICMEERNKRELVNMYGESEKLRVINVADVYKAHSFELMLELMMKLH